MIESTDFAIGKKVKNASKDDEYSAKLKHTGRRYQMVIDFDGRVGAFWGGYTPKMYDRDFIEAMKTTFEEKFRGGVILETLKFKGTFSRNLFPLQDNPSQEQQNKKSRRRGDLYKEAKVIQ